MSLPPRVASICPYCGEEYRGEHGVRTHVGKAHADEDAPEHKINLAVTGSLIDQSLMDIDPEQEPLKSLWSADKSSAKVLGELMKVQAIRLANAVERDPGIDGERPEPSFGYDDRGYAAEDRFGID